MSEALKVPALKIRLVRQRSRVIHIFLVDNTASGERLTRIVFGHEKPRDADRVKTLCRQAYDVMAANITFEGPD